MEIKLPIVLEARDYHSFTEYKDLLNKVLKSSHESKSVKEAVDFIEIGCSRDYFAYFYDTSFKLDNNQIIETLLSNSRGQFKNETEVIEYIEDFVNNDIVNRVDLPLVIKNLEKESPFFKISKSKKNSI